MIKIRLTKQSYKVLSSICKDIAQVFFGAFIGGIAILSLDPIKFFVLLLELGFALGFWYLVLYFDWR